MSTDSPITRPALRERLHALRDALATQPPHGKSGAALAKHLAQALEQLSPEALGLYWPMRSEFNAAAACLADPGLAEVPFALPFARRSPLEMGYRAWDRAAPTLVDECGVASADGRPLLPDVVLAPCLGFTAEGYRLGYGGGYFDRWLAANPQVTAIGIAWSGTEVSREVFDPQPHDVSLMLIVTEKGIVSG